MPFLSSSSPPEEAFDRLGASEPADPRRTADVQAALRAAARRDPPGDVFKPIGRTAFIIWGVVLFTLSAASYGLLPILHETEAVQSVSGFVQDLTGSDRSRRSLMRAFDRSDHQLEILSVLGIVAGSLVFAAYYLVVYLIGLPGWRRLTTLASFLYVHGVRQARSLKRRLGQRRKTSAGTEPRFD